MNEKSESKTDAMLYMRSQERILKIFIILSCRKTLEEINEILVIQFPETN